MDRIDTALFLFGALISYYFTGFYTLQLHRHVKASIRAKDRLAVHVTVAVVTVLEILQIAFTTHVVFSTLVPHAGYPSTLTRITFSNAMLPALNGLVAFVVQSFRLWRIHTFTTSTRGVDRVNPFIFSLCLLQCAAAAVVSAALLRRGQSGENSIWFKIAGVAWLSLTTASDALITASIVLPMLEWKASSPFSRSRKILDSVILKTVETGSVTVLVTIPYLVAHIAYPSSTLGTAFQFILGILYANVLLASLNGRERIRESEDESDVDRHLPWIVDGDSLSLSARETPDSTRTIASHTVQPIAMDLYRGSPPYNS